MDENPYKSPETSGAGQGPSFRGMATAVLYWLFAVSLIVMMVVAGVATVMFVIFTIAD